MSFIVALLFAMSLPPAAALGMRFARPQTAAIRLSILSGALAVLLVAILVASGTWMNGPGLFAIGLISFVTPLALGMASWRTPDMIEGMQASLDQWLEPYIGRSVNLLSPMHRICDIFPATWSGVGPSKKNPA